MEGADRLLLKTEQHVWKVLWHLYEKVPGICPSVWTAVRADGGRHTRIVDESKEICLSYQKARFFDDEPTRKNRKAFFVLMTSHFCDLACLARRFSKRHAFEFAAEVVECLMRSEGWDYRSAKDCSRFRKAVASLDRKLTRKALAKEIAVLLPSYWYYANEVLDRAFDGVEDFRQRQGNDLYCFATR